MAARPFDYPKGMGPAQKRRFKETELLENPDTLWYDTRRDDSRCNLIFFTNFPADWKASILDQYPETEEIQLPDKIQFKLSGKLVKGTVCIYPSGKFVIQGSESNLDEFDERFKTLKLQMEIKKL